MDSGTTHEEQTSGTDYGGVGGSQIAEKLETENRKEAVSAHPSAVAAEAWR
jgi:hypothetical protein